jgi:hypothetical protein
MIFTLTVDSDSEASEIAVIEIQGYTSSATFRFALTWLKSITLNESAVIVTLTDGTEHQLKVCDE